MHTITSSSETSRTVPASVTPISQSSRLLHRLFPTVLTLVTLTIAVGLLVLDWRAASLIDVVCWLIVLIAVWISWSWYRASGTLLDPYGLWVLSALAFNGGQAILEVLGLNLNGVLASRFSPETTVTALLCVALGLIAMHLGALLAIRSRQSPSNAHIHGPSLRGDLRSLRRVGLILLAVSIVPTVASLFQGLSVVAQSGYFGLYQQQAGVGFEAGAQILAGFFVPAIFLLFVGSGSSRGYALLAIALLGIYCGINLTLGARYSAVAPLIAFAWLWHRYKRPLSKRVLLLGGAVVLFLIFPLVGSTRNTALTERSSLDVLVNPDESINPATASLSEMGGTLQTVAYTIDLVPTVRPYDYGLQYGYSLLTIVPNFVWDVHPTIARGTPSTWLVRLVDPTTAAAGGGWGYSFIAEAYLNFGFWGAPLMLFIIGFVYARFVVWAIRSDDAAKIAVVGIYLTSFLVFARSDSASIIRPLVWYALLPYGLIHLLSSRQIESSVESSAL